MKQLWIGIGTMLFGIIVGGIGIATAGVGIGIPVVPIGIYISYRGWREFSHTENNRHNENKEQLEPFEQTKLGKVGIGLLLLIVGIGTSALIIGIPIAAWGLWSMYKAFEKDIKKFQSNKSV